MKRRGWIAHQSHIFCFCLYFVSVSYWRLFQKRQKLFSFDLPLTFSVKGKYISNSRTFAYEGVAPRDYKDDRQATLTLKYQNGSRQ